MTIKREGEHWYVCLSCEVEKPEPLPVSYEDVGIDLGVTHFAALSDGSFIESPRHYRTSEKKLKKLQETLSRKKRGSHRRARAVKRVAKAHRKVRNQRQDFAQKASRRLVNRFQVIVFEDLPTANLVKRPKPKQDEETGQYVPNGAAAKAGLNKSMMDGVSLWECVLIRQRGPEGQSSKFLRNTPARFVRIAGMYARRPLMNGGTPASVAANSIGIQHQQKSFSTRDTKHFWAGRVQLRRSLPILWGDTFTYSSNAIFK